MKRICLILILFLTSLLAACSNLSCSDHGKHNCDLCDSFYNSFVCNIHHDDNSDFKCDICNEKLTIYTYNNLTVTTLSLSRKTYTGEGIGVSVVVDREAFIE